MSELPIVASDFVRDQFRRRRVVMGMSEFERFKPEAIRRGIWPEVGALLAEKFDIYEDPVYMRVEFVQKRPKEKHEQAIQAEDQDAEPS